MPILKKDNISPLKLWLASLVCLCLVFAPFLCNFTWGNHDWMPLIQDNSFLSGLIEGRFTQYLLLNFLLMGKILPILNILIGFAFYSTALILICTRFFDFKITPVTALICLTVSILPYITEILYFQFIVLSQLSWPLIIVLSLLAAKKAEQSPFFWTYTLLSTVLLLIAIGGYPACANMFITATVTYLMYTALQKITFKKWLKQTLPFLISFILAFAALSVIYTDLRQKNMMLQLYNNSIPSITTLFQKIIPTILDSLQSFIRPQPFFSPSFKLITAFILIIFTTQYLKKAYTTHKLLLALGLLPLLLLGTKFSAWIVDETPENYFSLYDPAAYMVRADFYAIPTLLMFALMFICHQKTKLIKNITLISATLLFFISAKADATYTKTHLLGFKAENLLLQRIIERITQQTTYQNNNLYTITQSGELPLRYRYYQSSPLEKYGYYTLQVPFTRYWVATEYYNFYEPKDFIKEGTTINLKDISSKMDNFINQKMTVWPSQNSLFVGNNNIILILTDQGKKDIQAQFKKLEKIK